MRDTGQMMKTATLQQMRIHAHVAVSTWRTAPCAFLAQASHHCVEEPSNPPVSTVRTSKIFITESSEFVNGRRSRYAGATSGFAR